MKTHKLLHRLIILVCSLALLAETYLCLSRYFQGATTLNVDIRPNSAVDFPEFTICPDVTASFQSEKLKQDNFNESQIVTAINMPNMTWDQMLDITNDPEDLFFMLRMRNIKDGQFMFVTNNSEDFKKNARFTFERRYGRCTTISIPKRFQDKGLGDILMKFPQTVNVFIHHKNHYYSGLHPKVYARHGRVLVLDLKFELLELIPGKDCDHKLDQDFDTCFIFDTLDRMMSMRNCVLPYFWPGHEHIHQYPICVGNRTQMMEEIVVSRSAPNCLPPCKVMPIDFGYPFERGASKTENPQHSYVFFKLDHTIQVKTMVYSYSFISMVAEIGGYSGLLLGISVLDLYNVGMTKWSQ